MHKVSHEMFTASAIERPHRVAFEEQMVAIATSSTADGSVQGRPLPGEISIEAVFLQNYELSLLPHLLIWIFSQIFSSADKQGVVPKNLSYSVKNVSLSMGVPSCSVRTNVFFERYVSLLWRN